MTNLPTVVTPSWPRRRAMPDLIGLDEHTKVTVLAAVDRLRRLRGEFGSRFLMTVRRDLPAYGVLSDEEIVESAAGFMEQLISELEFLRVPDDALRILLEDLATRRAARGLPPDVLSTGYQLGSRVLLEVIDEVAAEVGLPPNLLLAVHDSTWEFANEASSVFARVQHDLAVSHARFDAERRSGFVRGVLGGGHSVDQIERDAHLFGVDPHARSVPLVARRPTTPEAAEVMRHTIAAELRMPLDRLLFADLGPVLGCIAPAAPRLAPGFLVAVGRAARLVELHEPFEEAVLALDTAERFALDGVVTLLDLGPRPLVLAGGLAAAGLEARHFGAMDRIGPDRGDLERTMRTYLDCDRNVSVTASHLNVHPNTVRYRVARFTQLTGLTTTRTEDLVTAWWLLHRRRNA